MTEVTCFFCGADIKSDAHKEVCLSWKKHVKKMTRYIVKEDTVGAKMTTIPGSDAQLLTSGELSKGTEVELIENPERYPLTRTVRVIGKGLGTTYQILKNKLEKV